jgi:hypothetical protein
MDQFYTTDTIAQHCIDTLSSHVSISSYDVVLEPSAGKGAFYKLLPPKTRIGIDLDPKCDGVQYKDFLEYAHETDKKYLIVGNPPFGKISSLAVKFFNKAATFSEVIAFIIPRTFKRVSIQNQLDARFHLLHSEDLPLKPCCFEPAMSAKCCFQIWMKKEKVLRPMVVYNKTHTDFSFVKLGPLDANNQPTPPTTADFALKAYGSGCGQIVTEGLDKLRPKSWHWIKSNIDVDVLMDRMKKLDYSMSKDTVRQDSLGQQELIYLYEQCEAKDIEIGRTQKSQNTLNILLTPQEPFHHNIP